MRRKTALRATALVSATASLVAVCSAASALAPAAATASSTPALPPADKQMNFQASGMDGAGFQNVVAVDPKGSGLVISGADVSGFHRSTDWGRTWTTSNLGLTNLTQLHVAAVAFSPVTAGKVFAAVGHRGTGGGLLVSNDGGRTWALRSAVPRFSGSNNVAPLPSRHPRSTGQLLAFDPAHSAMYAATYNQGVLRSTDDGKTWKTLGLSGKYLRSIAIDPANPNVVYAGTYGDGIYRTTTASTSGTFAKLAGSPAEAEELRLIGGSLYVAGGQQGVFRSADAGQHWTRLAPKTGGPTYISVDGYRSAGKDVVVVGTDRPAKDGTMADSLLRTTDSGATWSSLTARADRIHNEVGGPGGSKWWLLDRQASMALGRGGYTAADIKVVGSRIFVAGRSGVWSSADGGTNWYPMVKGMQVTINKQVLADPNTTGRVYIANTDWVTLYSTDGGATVRQNRPSAGALSTALALDTSTSPSVVYSAVGARDTNTDGEIYVNTDPAKSTTWTSQGLRAAVGGKRAVAMAVQRVNGSPVILAAVQGGGVWRKAAGKWAHVSAPGVSLAGDFASMTWGTGDAAYLHDPTTGVWRSSDGGSTWTRIWSKSSRTNVNGTLALDPTAPGRLYVSVTGDAVYRLDNARKGAVGSGVTATKLSGISRPGPIAVGRDGRLYVAGGTSGAGQLQVTTTQGSRWSTVSNDRYREAANFPFSVTVGAEGNAYLSLNGNGVLRGHS